MCISARSRFPIISAIVRSLGFLFNEVINEIINDMINDIINEIINEIIKEIIKEILMNKKKQDFARARAAERCEAPRGGASRRRK